MVRKNLVRKRILSFSVLFLILGIFPGSLYIYSSYKDCERERDILVTRQTDMMNHFQLQIETSLNRVFTDLEYLASSSVLLSFLEDPEERAALERDWLLFSETRARYDQIRYLDARGRESVRINFNSGVPEAVSQGALQNKEHRYYFARLKDFDEPTILVSPLDLNIEHRRVEVPLKPMIRFSMPLYDGTGVFRGALVLNYLADHLLSHLDCPVLAEKNEIYLLNAGGYLLAGPVEEQLWGFMFPDSQDMTFSRLFGEEAAEVTSGEETIHYSEKGFFLFRTIYGDLRQQTDPADASIEGYEICYMEPWWRIVSFGSPVGNMMFRSNLLVSLMGSLWKIELLFLIISLSLSYLISSLMVRKTAAEEMKNTYRNAMREVINALEITTSLEDDDTGNHIRRVCRYTRILALAYGLPGEDADLISEMAALHDIGKVGIHDSILKKEGILTAEEREEMKKHVTFGYDVTSRIHVDPVAENIVLYHHENWDRSGYVHNLSGEEIPLEARLVSLADVYDALRSERSYKQSFSHERAMDIILSERGRKFDPAVVDAFKRVEHHFLRISEDLAEDFPRRPAVV